MPSRVLKCPLKSAVQMELGASKGALGGPGWGCLRLRRRFGTSSSRTKYLCRVWGVGSDQSG
jgi:hypothetical protein